MEIKDLAGLSQPMTKLIEVVAQGIGGWAKPWQIKRVANAKAYEIETVARALRNNSDAFKTLEYDGEKVKLLCEQSGVSPEAAQELIALNQRAVSRLTHRELRRQANIEKAVHYAMDELLQVEHVSAEPVDEDWIARFFNIVEDVSNEQMQQLWGRILAGEIKRPKSFSLRTLDILRDISPSEAKLFCKLCKYVFLSKDKSTAFVYKNEKWIKEEMKMTAVDISLLQDIRLLSNGNVANFLLKDIDMQYVGDMPLGKKSISAILLTKQGIELSRLISIEYSVLTGKFIDFYLSLDLKEHTDNIHRENIDDIKEELQKIKYNLMKSREDNRSIFKKIFNKN